MRQSFKKKSFPQSLFSPGNAFIALPVLMITVLVFVPMIMAFVTSFKTGNAANMTFGGLINYKRLLQDKVFQKAFVNTFTYLIIQVPVMLILALSVAFLLNDKQLKFKGLFRTALFLPCITSLVSYSLIMKSLFRSEGVINNLLKTLHLIDAPIQWMTDPFWAKVLIIVSITWRWTGYNMIFFISGMQNIDPEIYEAAMIDGASRLQQLFRITIPNLKPIILFTTITCTIGTLQLFDETRNITNGGPANATLTLSQYIYNLSFKFNAQFGYAAAVSFVIVVCIVVLSFVQRRLAGND